MYGVSPQPAHAPENSIKGTSNCTSLTCECDRRLRSNSGIDRKNCQFLLSGSRRGACGAMLMALCFASLLLFAGQISTQRAQPVQSSGETCSVYRKSWNSRQRGWADLNGCGALARREES